MISTKKLATVGAAAALFASSAMPALAWHWSDDDLNITQKNYADVTNTVAQNANTGNQVDGLFSGHNKAIGTGAAANGAIVTNVLNSNKAKVDSCDCFDDVTIKQKNSATVTNTVVQNANTGNQTSGLFAGGNKAIFTGDAANGAVVTNVVNSNVAKVN